MAHEQKAARTLWRLCLTAAVWLVIFVSAAMAARKVRHYVVSDPQFVLSAGDRGALSVQGVVYASRWRIRRVFASDFGRSIFAIPLAERRRRLLAIDWLEDASVSRVWPNHIVARVNERTPVAFVTLRKAASPASGVLLIDRYGVLLDPPPRSHFAFPVLSGISEEQDEAERRRRVQVMMRLLEDLGPLAKDISEVNAADPDNLKVIAQVGGSVLELTLGDANYAARYQNFLGHYQEIRKRSGNATAFDLRLDDRITAKE